MTDKAPNQLPDFVIVLALIILVLIGAIAGSLIGSILGEDSIRKEAIEAGVAEYAVDSKTGIVTFKWLIIEKKEE